MADDPSNEYLDVYDKLSNDKSYFQKMMIRAYQEHETKVTDLLDQFHSTDDWGKKEHLLKQTHIEKEKFEHLIKEIEEGITDAEGMLDKTARKEIASLKKYYIKKIRTKDPVDGGISYKEKRKKLDALDKYEKLVAGGMKRLTAKNRVRRLKKFDWSLGTLKKYLTKARKLRQQP